MGDVLLSLDVMRDGQGLDVNKVRTINDLDLDFC